MSSEQVKRLPTRSLDLTMASRQIQPTMRTPEVKEPFGGRRGRQLANEQRERYFRVWHKLVLERLVIESSIILDDYAQEVVLQAITQMWDRYYSTQCYPGSEAFLKQFTEMCTQQLVANVRAILENHIRVMGDLF